MAGLRKPQDCVNRSIWGGQVEHDTFTLGAIATLLHRFNGKNHLVWGKKTEDDNPENSLLEPPPLVGG
jgi:hypothetical protein